MFFLQGGAQRSSIQGTPQVASTGPQGRCHPGGAAAYASHARTRSGPEPWRSGAGSFLP